MEQKDIIEKIKEADIKIKKKLFIDSGNILVDIISWYNSIGKYDEVKKIYEQYMPLMNIDNKCLKNKLLNEYELASKKYFLSSYPRQLYVMVTNACNLSCIMCSQRREKMMHMPKKYLYDILELAPYLQEIIWQGGEILLLKNFKEILFKLSEYNNIKHSIVSNFQTNDEELIKFLPTLNIGLTISVDGSTKQLYEKIRTNAKFELLISNIKLFNEIRFKQNNPVPLGMHFVVMKENYHDIANIVDFAHENDFNHIQYIYIKGDKASELNDDDKKNIFALVNAAKEKAAKYNLYINVNSVLDELGNMNSKVVSEIKNQQNETDNELLYCHFPWYRLTFDTNYNFAVDCCCLKKENYLDKSILDCWNSDLMQEYRKRIINMTFENICKKNCFLRNR